MLFFSILLLVLAILVSREQSY